MDKVEKLYQNYEILADAKNKPADHEDLFLEIIGAAKGETSEKMLACQFIPRFLKMFPSLAESALDAQLDMLEDSDAAVRKQVVKYLPSICKENKDFIAKISDALTQMLQSEDTAELSIIHTALMTILKLDIKASLDGIFSQISTSEDETIRKRGIQFLCTKLKFLPPELLTIDVEEYVISKCQEAFAVVGGDDFLALMPLLSNLKIAKEPATQKKFVSLIAEQAELECEFEANLPNAAGLLQCVRLAIPYFSSTVKSTPFLVYLCLFVLPKMGEIEELENGYETKLELLKLMAEISPFSSTDKQMEECVETLYKLLLFHIPLPPPPDSENVVENEPDLQFTHIECLMFTFTNLLKHCPEFLTAPDHAARYKDLKARLQFLARGVQTGIKTFRESLVSSKAKESKQEDTKMKAIALRTMNNINSLIKDLFRIPPTFKTTVQLSWKPIMIATSKAATGVKRESDSLAGSDSSKMMKKDSKVGRELYQPPGGKFSTNVNFSRPRGNSYYRGRGRRFY